MIKDVIVKLTGKEDLAPDEMRSVFNEIMGGKVDPADIKEFLVTLAEKGETADEITQAVMVMREKMKQIDLPFDTILDTCGTGGGESSFNVSTIVGMVVAGCGVKVAKHGNRSYTSHCGSADILEHLGVKIDISPEKVAECIEKIGIGFMFAPLYHSAMKHVVNVRREIKRRTIFNILGPLSNPAGANTQLIGVFDEALTELLARVLGNLGSKRAFVVHGLDGFDEVSISDETKVSELNRGKVSTYRIKPEDCGIKRSQKEDVACGALEENISVVKSVLNGERSPKRDMVLINASLALNAAGGVMTCKEGIDSARHSIDSGRAMGVLEALVKLTNE